MSRKKESDPGFEQAMTDLEQLVSRLEKDNVSLEESLKQFEKGIHLARVCQQALSKAEQEIKMLTENGETDFKLP